MTIANIIQGVVNALYEGFSGITIYTESVMQDLQTPCVLVRCLEPSQARDLDIRYIKSCPLAVQYISEHNTNEECNAASEVMFEALEDITVNDRILHGRDLQATTSDGVVTFTVRYDVFLMKTVETDEMETCDVDMVLHGGEQYGS